ncbi:reverse transcriptase zinc-binding domain-containing protein [Artemisia annua]|uniref:Reverse transcriptase zinc-binding domain-containing protein n=1 Tax=Artemisia annua TaxID=35608 RepID=A0A2U1KUG9_ARTAN|nr:reverse transcriptase zinc-binding domain-containing protein [Artemisia annua]
MLKLINGLDPDLLCTCYLTQSARTSFQINYCIPSQSICSAQTIFELNQLLVACCMPNLGSLSLDRILHTDNYDWVWKWRRQVRDGREASDLAMLLDETQGVSLSENEDGWRWLLDSSGKFSVSSVRVAVDKCRLPTTDLHTNWNNFVPSKINILIWRANKKKGSHFFQHTESEPLIFRFSLVSAHLVTGMRMKDGWRWLLDSSGKFSVSSVRVAVDKCRLPTTDLHTNWNNFVPSKINILIWRAERDRLPTRINLDSLGIDLHSLLCPMCDTECESLEHVLVSCQYSSSVWQRVFSWWRFGMDLNPCLRDITRFVQNLSSRKKGMLKPIQLKCFEVAVFSTVCNWVLWKSRNSKIFTIGSKSPNSFDLFHDVQSVSFCWINNRCTNLSIDWSIWLSDPLSACLPNVIDSL